MSHEPEPPSIPGFIEKGPEWMKKGSSGESIDFKSDDQILGDLVLLEYTAYLVTPCYQE